jgi:hypothetical protein
LQAGISRKTPRHFGVGRLLAFDKQNAHSLLFSSPVSPARQSLLNDSDTAMVMAAPTREPSLSAEQRRALALLASNLDGIIEELLVLAHGFNRDMIAGLVEAGLATAQREILAASDRTTIDVVRIRISDAGRRALEG